MDTKTLVVGQEVFMVNTPFINKGKVVKVTPSGVEVESVKGELIFFDAEGNEIEVDVGQLPDPARPWHLEDISAERRERYEAAFGKGKKDSRVTRITIQL